jgi:hypothetical protein
MTAQLEYVAAGDAFRDFCRWDYQPIAPTAGKLRSASLLFQSFAVDTADAGYHHALIRAIRDAFGMGSTVWGVKQRGSTLAWEFYFYDYRLQRRTRSITRFLDLAKPFAASPLRVNERLPYFMFSVDIGPWLGGDGVLDELHMYIGNAGSTVSSGICYAITPQPPRLENFYFFFDARSELAKVRNKAACSLHFDSSHVALDDIIWPELRACAVIVIANKPDSDGVYFSRINVDQLRFFLTRMGYPAATIAFLDENRGKLDHLLYDVGFDYRLVDDQFIIEKSAYYGLF